MTIYYIAGPLNGLSGFSRQSFNAMAYRIEDEGLTALNPAILPDGLTQEQYMGICFAMLRCATHVVMLDDWEDSTFAQRQRFVAINSGLIVEYENMMGIKAVSNG